MPHSYQVYKDSVLHKITNVWHCELIPRTVIAGSKSNRAVGARHASPPLSLRKANAVQKGFPKRLLQ